jgi:hypothetical protein
MLLSELPPVGSFLRLDHGKEIWHFQAALPRPDPGLPVN